MKKNGVRLLFKIISYSIFFLCSLSYWFFKHVQTISFLIKEMSSDTWDGERLPERLIKCVNFYWNYLFSYIFSELYISLFSLFILMSRLFVIIFLNSRSRYRPVFTYHALIFSIFTITKFSKFTPSRQKKFNFTPSRQPLGGAPIKNNLDNNVLVE